VLLSSFRGNAQIITTPITGYSTPESTPTVSPSMIGTPTITPTHTVSPTITGTNTPFISPTFTITQTCTPSPTVTPTCTPVSAVVEVLLEVIDYAVRSGETARVRINVRNSGKDPAVNAVLWDSIPSGASLESGSSDNASWAFSSGVITRNIGTIMPGESRTYYYLLRADTGLPEQYIIAVPEANCAFNDMLSPAVPKISISLPGTIAILGQIHIYPNPFNPRTANGGKLKITGAPRDTKITIYSVSGELVISFFADASIVLWDGKNRYGKTVSPGVYFYHISWDSDKQYVKGKIFITSFE